MAEKLKEDVKKKKTTLDIVSNIYREATEYDAGKVLTIAKSIVSTLQANPYLNKVAKENVGSLVNCVRQAISLGLPIDANNYCYLIPYKEKANNWKPKLTLQVGYKGYVYKILKAYPKVKLQACLVREGDKIKIYKKENNDYVDHKYENPFEKEEKGKEREIIGVYSIITFPDGKSVVEILNKKDIETIKSVSKKDKDGERKIWDKWEGEMIKKSVLKRACKIHFSAEIVDLNVFDNQMYDVSPKPKKLSKTAGLEEKNSEL